MEDFLQVSWRCFFRFFFYKWKRISDYLPDQETRPEAKFILLYKISYRLSVSQHLLANPVFRSFIRVFCPPCCSSCNQVFASAAAASADHFKTYLPVIIEHACQYIFNATISDHDNWLFQNFFPAAFNSKLAPCSNDNKAILTWEMPTKNTKITTTNNSFYSFFSSFVSKWGMTWQMKRTSLCTVRHQSRKRK